MTGKRQTSQPSSRRRIQGDEDWSIWEGWGANPPGSHVQAHKGTGLAPVRPCLSCTGDRPKADTTPDKVSQVPRQEMERITSLELLAALLLIQLKMLLASFAARAHCWLMFNLLSTRNSRSFSAELLPRQSASSLYCCTGLFQPRCGTWHLFLSNIMKYLSAHFSSLSRSL